MESLLVQGVALLDAEGQRLAVKYMQSNGSGRAAGAGGGRSSSEASAAFASRRRAAADVAAATVAGGSSRLRAAGEGISNVEDYAAQRHLEQQMLSRFVKIVGRNEVEAFEVEKYVVLGKSLNDVFLFLVGDQQNCNEVFFLEIFTCLVSVLTSVTGGQINKKSVLDNLDLVFLMFDEMFDDGLLLECEPNVVLARLQMQDGVEIEAATCTNSNSNSGAAAASASDAVSTQTAFNQAITNAKENLIRSLLSGGS